MNMPEYNGQKICNHLHGSSPTIEATETHIKYVQDYVARYLADDYVRYVEAKNVVPQDANYMVYGVIIDDLREQIIKGFSCLDNCGVCLGKSLERWMFSVLSNRVKNYFSHARDVTYNLDDYVHVLHTVNNIRTDLDENAHDSSLPFFLPDDEINEGKLRYVDPQTHLDRELHESIKNLKKKERQYIIARYFRGAKDSKEVAEMMGITHVYARKIKQRVMKKLNLDLGSFFESD